MKNMKKLLQKAMVFTLSAAMLVGTPMTASAAGLVDLYSISDGTEIVDDINKGPVGTVTNTDTNTGAMIKAQSAKIVGIALDRETVSAEVGTSETLKATVMLDSEIKVPETYGSDVLVDITDRVVAEMSKKIKWEVLYVDEYGKAIKDDTVPNPAEKVAIAGRADNRSEITLDPQQGTEKGGEVTVRATIDASYYFQGTEDVTSASKEQDALTWNKWTNNPDKYIIKDEREGLIYTADAKVSVKEYSTGLSWSDTKTNTANDSLDMKHTVDLSDKLVRDPKTANDEITWVSDTPKYATVSATGVVTAKKETPDNTTVKITAVSERGAVAERNFTIGKGVKADEVEIWIDGVDQTKRTVEQNLTSDPASRQMTVTAKLYAKVKAFTKDGEVVKPAPDQIKAADTEIVIEGNPTNNVKVENGEWYIGDDRKPHQVQITDTITWSSNKAAVATVGATTGAVDLKGIGTAAITAKATNGKSAKVNVKVTANLNDLTIVAPTKAYSGQTITLGLTRDPVENKDAVKWSVTDEDGGKINYATINAKGILTIKNQVTAGKIKVKVETTKAVKDVTNEDGTTEKIKVGKTATLTVAQSSIDGITVYEGTDTGKEPIAKVGLNDKKKIAQLMKAGTSNLNVPLTQTYTAVVEGNNLADGTQQASLLTWKTSNAKVASLKQTSGGKVEIKAEGSGTAKITVSGVREVTNPRNNKKTASVISTSFTVKVKQPVTTLTMNKPTVTLAEKYKKVGKGTVGGQPQNVPLKVTFGPKKADKNQTKIASWTLTMPDGTEKPITNAKGVAITTANVSCKLDAPKAGETYKITAKSITGATATCTVTIANPTTEVAIARGITDGKLDRFKETVNNKEKLNETVLIIGKNPSTKMTSYINLGTAEKKENGTKTDWVVAGDRNSEEVTYTVNKKGIVTIDKYGNVYAVKKGVVTITAKTPTGKKATLKVTVNDK